MLPFCEPLNTKQCKLEWINHLIKVVEVKFWLEKENTENTHFWLSNRSIEEVNPVISKEILLKKYRLFLNWRKKCQFGWMPPVWKWSAVLTADRRHRGCHLELNQQTFGAKMTLYVLIQSVDWTLNETDSNRLLPHQYTWPSVRVCVRKLSLFGGVCDLIGGHNHVWHNMPVVVQV